MLKTHYVPAGEQVEVRMVLVVEAVLPVPAQMPPDSS